MSDGPGGRFALRPTELIGIAAFWASMALLAMASRTLNPRLPDLPVAVSQALVKLSLAEYVIWGILTIPIFWLADRLTRNGVRRLEGFVIMVVIGLVLAIFVDAALAAYRIHLFAPIRPGLARPIVMRRLMVRGVQQLGFLYDLIVYFAVMAAGIARSYVLQFQSRQEETVRLQAQAASLEARLAEARLATLRAQIDPHFLFNTLNAVSALVERDPAGVRRMLARLSELLRETLESPPDAEVPLSKELDVVRRYVEIMQVRFQGKLEVSIHTNAALEQAFVPSFLLQPLVENAIKHGASRTNESMGRVIISVERTGEQLVIRVQDNGPGVTEVSDSATTGVGLANTRARLSTLYGANQSVTLGRNAAGETVAEVRLPFHTAPLRQSGGHLAGVPAV